MRMVCRYGAMALIMMIGLGARAQEVSGPAVQGVIQSQLDAFLRDDVDEAFTFAAPGIRSIFRNPDNFGAMVREGYPMVWRPAEVQFGQTEAVGGRVEQTVIITDASGAVHALLYELTPVDGAWKISGVRILRAPDVGA